MKPATRHKARRHAIQALYQVLFTKEESSSIVAQHLAEMDVERVDADYFRHAVFGTLKEMNEIDRIFESYMDRGVHELTPIELCVLRLATFELKHNLDVPYRVILNEALKLTKTFGTDEGYKFVNGVLDRTAKELRKVEYQNK